MAQTKNNKEVNSKAAMMPLLTISSPETIQKCKNLVLRPSDIFICSYPKSGTTWMQHIIISLLLLHRCKIQQNSQQQQQQKEVNKERFVHDDDDEKCGTNMEYNHVSDYAPFFEIDPHWKTNKKNELIDSIQEKHAQIGRRIFNTHLRCDMLPNTYDTTTTDNKNHENAKFIYIIRSPLDTCVSFYYHLSNQVEGCYDKSLNEFFKEWMNGDLPFGSWVDHVQSYLSDIAQSSSFHTIYNNDNNDKKSKKMKTNDEWKPYDGSTSRDILLLSYENMASNLKSVIFQLIQFLHLDDYIHHQDITPDILQSFSFHHMKQNINLFQPKSVSWKNDFTFLRKGQIGDSKLVLTQEQIQSFYSKHTSLINDVPSRDDDDDDTTTKDINHGNFIEMVRHSLKDKPDIMNIVLQSFQANEK